MTDQELQEVDTRINEGKATDEDIEKMANYLVDYMKELDNENSNDRRQSR